MIKNCALRGKSTKFGMVIVLGLLNNISYGPQSGGTFCTQGGGGEGDRAQSVKDVRYV